jgi:hypothetical protein
MEGATQQALNTLKAIALRNITSNENSSRYLWSVEPINYEGLRVNFDFTVASDFQGEDLPIDRLTGWCMLRPSLHEPILSMQIESDQMGGVKQAARILLSGHPGTNHTIIENCISNNDDNFLSFNQLGVVMDISQLAALALK